MEDYEKKYKEALNWIKDVYPTLEGAAKEDAEHYFPELKEGEGEQHRKWILEYLYDGLRKSDEQFKDHFKTAIDWLEKQGEQKPAEWSKEDERNFDIIYGIIYNSCNAEDTSRLIAWLKSLKDRVQPKSQSAEWSEEDIVAIDCAVEVLSKDLPSLAASIERLKSLRPQNWTKEDKERYISCLQRLGTGNPEQPETINSKWFKEHVYSQNRWKPSLAQLNALSIVSKGCAPDDIEAIMSLYQQLKELKE